MDQNLEENLSEIRVSLARAETNINWIKESIERLDRKFQGVEEIENSVIELKAGAAIQKKILYVLAVIIGGELVRIVSQFIIP